MKKNAYGNISQLLEEARNRLGKTQAAVAKEVGVSCPSYSRWESGDNFPKKEYIRGLTIALGISEDELLDCYFSEKALLTPASILPLLKMIIESGYEPVTIDDLHFLFHMNEQLKLSSELIIHLLKSKRPK